METIRPEQLKAINIPVDGQVPVYNSATEKFEWINASGVTSSGGGDMFKSVYDTDNNGIVDNAESAITVAWGGITGKPISDAQITDLTDGGVTTLHQHVTTSGTGFPWYNVKDYGATGNGTTDDTSSIQDAFDAATVDGGVVYFPAGTYSCNTITPYRDTSINGDGRNVSIIKSRAAEILLDYGTSADLEFFNGSVENISLEGNNVGTIGINITSGAYFTAKNVGTYQFVTAGWKLRAVLVGQCRDCIFDYNTISIDADSATLAGAGKIQANLMRLENLQVMHSSSWGIKWEHGSMLLLDGCDIEYCGTIGNTNTGGIYFKPVFEGLGMVITGHWSEHNQGGADILIDNPDVTDQHCSIENSLFVMTGDTDYGIQINGDSLVNSVSCKNVIFYQNASVYDYSANGASSNIYLNRCTGTYGGTGTVVVEETEVVDPRLIDPTTLAGDMIFRQEGEAVVDLATISGVSATAINSAVSHDPPKLIDGNDGTYWTASTSPVIGQWVKIDLGSEKTVGGFKIIQFGLVSTNYATGVLVEGSTDDANWDVIINTPINYLNHPDESTINFPELGSYRYIRFTAVNGGVGGWAIDTIEIYDNFPATGLARLPIGNESDVLTVYSGMPIWTPIDSLNLTFTNYMGTVISDTTLGSDTATFDVQNISAEYDRLEYILTGRTDEATVGSDVFLTINNDSTAGNYYGNNLYYSDAGAATIYESNDRWNGKICGDSAPANSFGRMFGTILGYANTGMNKNLECRYSYLGSTSTMVAGTMNVEWISTSAINRLTFSIYTGGKKFKAGSRLQIIGYKDTTITL
jgi:hypothetical protein